jgi:hypothetical protein
MPRLFVIYGKGAIWRYFDRVFGGADPRRRHDNKLAVLEGLHKTQHFLDFVHDAVDVPFNMAELREHIERDWFESHGSGAPTAQWRDWSGNAEGIVRETVIRAIEISLGVDHLPWTGARVDPLGEYGLSYHTPAFQNWPIEFWCASPVPMLQGSLSWSELNGEGRVVVTWLLPAAQGQEILSDFREASNDFRKNPNATSRDRFGSWIVGQELTVGQPRSGEPPLQVSTGELVVIEPKLAIGGVV